MATKKVTTATTKDVTLLSLLSLLLLHQKLRHQKKQRQ